MRVLLWVSAVAIAVSSGVDGRADPSKSATPLASKAATPGKLTPKELLVGTWKINKAIDKENLESYLATGGGYKVRPSRDALLEKLNREIATKVTIEFRIDGTVVRTTTREGGKSRVDQGDWKVLDENESSVAVETGYEEDKGLQRVRATDELRIVFRSKDALEFAKYPNNGMPLMPLLGERVAAGNLNYRDRNGQAVPPPWRKDAPPKDPGMVAKLEGMGVRAILDGAGDIVGAAFDVSPSKGKLGGATRPDLPTVLPLLSRIATMRSLFLPEHAASDDDLRQVAAIHALTELTMAYNAVGDDGMRNIAALTALEELDISHTGVTDAGMQHLAGLTCLSRLNISGTSIGDSGFAAMERFRNLRRLDAAQTPIRGAALRHLSGMNRLQMLNLRQTAVDDDGIANLKDLRDLTHLDLEGTEITDAGIKHLALLSRISVLCLAKTKIGDQSIEILVARNNLTELNLNETRVTDASLRLLQGAKGLTRLYVGGTQVTASGLRGFRSSQPGCRLIDWGKAAAKPEQP